MRHLKPISSLARTLATAFAVGLAAMAAQPALAWTDKPIKLIVPAPPGGTIDVAARFFVDQLSADLGQPVIVENKPGAGGGIAVQALLAAPADGQTLLVTTANVLVEIPHVMKQPYDVLKDLRPVVAVARAGLMLVSHPGVPAQDMKGLVAYLKANSGKLSFATYSAGTVSHYAGMILSQREKLDMVHAPFAGSPPALQQVMGGQIPIMFDGMITSTPLVVGGKLRAYAVSGKTRAPQMPQVPTFAEVGYPELDFSNWLGFVASSQLAPELADKINAAIAKAAATPKVRERLLGAGFEIVPPQSAAELAQWTRADVERNGAIVKTFNIKLN
jgi:tripartite-type tricarboxylate transporter receptor subunit TctC